MPDPNYSDSDEYVSLMEAGRRLGIESRRVIDLVDAGEIPYQKHRQLPCLRVSVTEYLRRHQPIA